MRFYVKNRVYTKIIYLLILIVCYNIKEYFNHEKIWIFAGLVVAIVIGFYTISPLFINRTVKESVPENVAIEAFNKFETLSNEKRLQFSSEMTEREKTSL